MKYIKKYNPQIEELSDYLQEIFDKYDLKELREQSTNYIGTWIITGGNKIDYPVVFNRTYPLMISITIGSDENFFDLNRDILTKKPNLEKRMGCVIYVRSIHAANRILISTDRSIHKL